MVYADAELLRDLRDRGVAVPNLPDVSVPPGAGATSAVGAKRARPAEGRRASAFWRPRTAPAASPDLLMQWERSSAQELAGFDARSRHTLTSLAQKLLPVASNPRKLAQDTALLTIALKAVAHIDGKCCRCGRDDAVQLWCAYPTAPRVGCRRCAKQIQSNWNVLSFDQVKEHAEKYDDEFKQPIIEL